MSDNMISTEALRAVYEKIRAEVTADSGAIAAASETAEAEDDYSDYDELREDTWERAWNDYLPELLDAVRAALGEQS